MKLFGFCKSILIVLDVQTFLRDSFEIYLFYWEISDSREMLSASRLQSEFSLMKKKVLFRSVRTQNRLPHEKKKCYKWLISREKIPKSLLNDSVPKIG